MKPIEFPYVSIELLAIPHLKLAVAQWREVIKLDALRQS